MVTLADPAPARHCEHADVVLVGGGLANSLIALRLAAQRPGLRVVMLERESVRDESHTWCLFETDVAPGIWHWLAPLFSHAWRGYDVAFPQALRPLSTGYARISSATLGTAVESVLGGRLRRGMPVVDIAPDAVTCADGARLRAPLVIDGRGLTRSDSLRLAWQKFAGLEIRCAAPHGLAQPVLMDACVHQTEGYRFFYLLPLSADALLVEDTRYSNSPLLDLAAIEAGISRYAANRGWPIAQVVRRECGVLPIVLSGDIDRFWTERLPGVPAVGMRGALFHPTTGYSLPDAARTADWIAATPCLESRAVAAAIEARSKRLWQRRSFYRGLNRMLFLAAGPEERYVVLQRFYGLSQRLVERFYADRLTLYDKARILTGRPPIPMRRAFAALQSSDLERAHA